MASQPNISLPVPIFEVVQEEATRQNKDVNEMAGELILDSIYRKKKSSLDELLKYGQSKAIETFGHVPSEQEVADIVRIHREQRRQ